MEAIKNYLETMFASLPNTAEVQKAKRELGQMMEDKYSELIAEGKSENEAIGTVISEFGNLEELAENLGIGAVVNQDTPVMSHIFPIDQVKEYIIACSHKAFLTALGVMLCILSPCALIAFDIFCPGTAGEAVGVTLLFVMIGIAVGLFIYAGMSLSKWEYLKQESYVIDFATTEFVRGEKNHYQTTHALILTIGIVLCVLCAVPAIIIDYVVPAPYADIAGAFVIVFVAIGVFMIVLTSQKNSIYSYLLRLNNAGTVGGHYVPEQENEVQYDNPTVAAIMSVFWQTTGCLYLIWSFLSFDWHITWIIWPVAAIINAVIKNLLGHR